MDAEAKRLAAVPPGCSGEQGADGLALERGLAEVREAGCAAVE